jgi:hypothetical protein
MPEPITKSFISPPENRVEGGKSPEFDRTPTVPGPFAGLRWTIRDEKEIQISEQREELESRRSDAVTDMPAKIELQMIHKRSYHPPCGSPQLCSRKDNQWKRV